MLYGALVTLRRGSRCASNSGWDGATCIMACASRYVGYGAGYDVHVTLCCMRCAGTVCVYVGTGRELRRGSHYVAGGVTVTMYGLRYAGNTTWQTLCRSRYVGHGVLAYILELKLNSEVSKSIAHVSVLYNIDVTCLHGNDATCCIILHATVSFSTYNQVIVSPTFTHLHIMAIRINRFYLSILFVCQLVCELAYIYNVHVCLSQQKHEFYSFHWYISLHQRTILLYISSCTITSFSSLSRVK